ncbi:MAG: Calx-beta domain-containing protein, partial [Thermoanaerobaculia bacterium]
GAYSPSALIDAGGRPFFFAAKNIDPFHRGLWTTDGTPSGTYAVIPDLHSDYLYGPENVAGTLFFLKTHNEGGELWKSDGTLDGTTVVKELPFVSGITELKAAGRRLFLLTGNALWTSDGTESGTIEVLKNLETFPGLTSNLFAVGSRVVFAKEGSFSGYELWTSDGTKDGTKLLLDLRDTVSLTNVDGTVYFAGSDDLHGTEAWTTDGTADGTKLLFDLNPGFASSNPSSFTRIGDLLYFSAYTAATGGELWALPLTDPQISISDTRATEGDTGTTVARFAVSLSRTAKQPVAVDYATSDGTALAGADYDAASGTLSFAPGETAKTIDIHVRGDVSPENNETFFVTLRNASGARVIRSEGAGVIEDDDQDADLSVVPQFAEGSFGIQDSLTIANAGPRSATDIDLKITSTPDYGRTKCFPCSIAQMAMDTTTIVGGDVVLPLQQAYGSATVTARQRDPRSSNNGTT